MPVIPFIKKKEKKKQKILNITRFHTLPKLNLQFIDA